MTDMATEKYTELELYDLKLYEQLEYLERNIASIEQDLADPPDNSLPDDIDAEALPETIKALELECDQLRTELTSAFQEGVIKTTALQSLNASHLVIKNLYPENPEERSKLFQEIEKRDDLVSEYLLAFEELRPYQTWIKETESNIIEVQQENRQLMASIVKAEGAAKESALAREATQRIEKLEREAAVKSDALDRQQAASARDSSSAPSEDFQRATEEGGSQRRREELSEDDLQLRIKKTRNMLEFARNVLQGVIVESGIDWSESDRWLQVILTVGEEI
ncbi:hypothetical protein BC943DRAFT_330704 [Umbelopsis sp. AD052]|nr:hypothetical protein BC943DRAFT_330704 [Umbelopsis sp. AD052]